MEVRSLRHAILKLAAEKIPFTTVCIVSLMGPRPETKDVGKRYGKPRPK
jgi:hypothetical protein